MLLICVAFGIGLIAGLRSLTAPAIMSWAARLGYLSLTDTWLAFLGYRWTPWIFSLLALGEIVNDKLPGTPSRKVPVQFAARILMGALSGASVTAPHGAIVPGLLAGALGAVAGTLGGAALRARLAMALGKDLPVALLEDAIAIFGGLGLLSQLS